MTEIDIDWSNGNEKQTYFYKILEYLPNTPNGNCCPLVDGKYNSPISNFDCGCGVWIK